MELSPAVKDDWKDDVTVVSATGTAVGIRDDCAP